MPPAMDYTFFKKPLSINVLAPQKGWGTPSASSSPMSKVPPKLSLDDLDTTKSMVDLAVLIEDDDNETFAPHKTDSSKSRETHGGYKWWGSPPAKKACTESPASQKTLKSKSCKASCTLWMNGKNVRNPGRNQSIKRCAILHLPWLWSWSNQSLRNALLINPDVSSISSLGFGKAFSGFQEYL